MAKWLKSCGVKSVAAESTGVYWIPVLEVLEEYEIELYLVDARQARNVPGRKSDVSDCQWLRQLHSYGLLRKAFVPDRRMRTLRSYYRQRGGLVENCSRQINLMQKALEQMNIQLHKALSDISGVSGLRIIRAILKGERDAKRLADMRESGVKRSRGELEAALTGNYRAQHLFALKQAVEAYDFYQAQLAECDERIQNYMSQMEGKSAQTSPARPKKKQGRRKNQPYFDLRGELHRITGVDLTQIEGIDAMTAMTVVSEQGTDMSRFPSQKHFCSHLGLCPNNRITGGKVLKRRTRKVQSRAAKALRLAAQSLHSSKTALGAFYRRMRARMGPSKAITATAHKLARLIYWMLKHGQDYVEKGQNHYEEQYRQRAIKALKRRANDLGYVLSPLQSSEGCVS